jgi:hypothetical protein
MLTRMICMLDREAPFSGRFVLVLMSSGIGVGYENIARHDSYAMVDYWATMYNIGRSTVDECKVGLAGGAEALPSMDERREIEATRSGQKPNG